MTWLLPSQLSHFAPVAECSTSASTPEPNTSASDRMWWLTLSGKPTQRPSSWPGWKKRPWSRLLFGAAISPQSSSTDWLKAWMRSSPASHAPTSRLQESVRGQTASDGSGQTSSGSSADIDRRSCGSKTCPACSAPPASEICAYVAGLIDGEGSITIQRNEWRGTPQYALSLAIEMDLTVRATSPNMLVSVRGCVVNEIMSALNHQDEQEIRAWIEGRKRHRRVIKRAYSKMRAGS